MKENKIYVILIAIVLIFCVVILLIFRLDNLKDEGYETTIIVENDTVWGYKNEKWSNISSFENLKYEKYDVYLNNEKKGNYYLSYNDKWYAYNDKNNSVKLDGNLLAIRSKDDVSVYDFNTSMIDDYSYVKNVLNDNNLPINSKYTVNKKIIIDYDNDGFDEEFYLISNAFPLDFAPDYIFSIVFMVKNKDIYTIYKNIEKSKVFNGCKPYISGFIDVDNDSKYEFILSCAEYSISGVNRMLYKYDDSEFKILISNNK